MNNLTDDQIKDIAESCGFWGVDVWWRDNIPRLRKFAEKVEAKRIELILTGENRDKK